MQGLCDIILKGERFDSRFSSFFSLFDDASTFLSENFLDYSTPQKLVLISHKADADGEASRTINEEGSREILRKLGNTQFEITSERFMDISPNPSAPNSLEGIKRKYGDAIYIFSDLGTLNVPRAKKIFNKAIILDHHYLTGEEFKNISSVISELSDDFFYINPCLHNIDGSKQFSGSNSSSLLMEKTAMRIFDGFEDYKKIERQIDILHCVGVSGSDADMQDDSGSNKYIYRLLEKKKKLVKVNSPFFGYFTKSLDKVLAESDIPLNLKYRLPSRKEIANILLKDKDNGIGKVSDGIYRSLKYLFVFDVTDNNSDNFCINLQYLNSLSSEEVEHLNSQFLSEFGEVFIKINREEEYPYMVNGKYETNFVFNDFNDDMKLHDKRIPLASRFLYSLDITKSEKVGKHRTFPTVFSLKRRNEKTFAHLIKEYTDNIIAFADPLMRGRFLSLLKREQYCFENTSSETLESKSVSEFGNHITALSKKGYGELLRDCIHTDFDSSFQSKETLPFENVFTEADKIHHSYRRDIFKVMEEVGPMILRGDKLKMLTSGLYFIMLDDAYKDAQMESNPETITGVVGSTSLSTRLIPGNYGTLLTGLTVNGRVTKISARSDRFSQRILHLGKLFRRMHDEGIVLNGGGHDDAASFHVYSNEIDTALDYITNNYIEAKRHK